MAWVVWLLFVALMLDVPHCLLKTQYEYFFEVNAQQSVETADVETSDNFAGDVRMDEEGKQEHVTRIYEYMTDICRHLAFALWTCVVAATAASVAKSYYKEKFLKRSIHELLKDHKLSDMINISPELQIYARSWAGQTDDSINHLIDLILHFYKQHVAKQGKTYIPVPDFRNNFQTKFLGIPVKGNIAADSGLMGDLSTVYRTSSFFLRGNLTDLELTLYGSLGLLNLNVNYYNYKIDILLFHPIGSLTVSVGSNSIYVEVTANLQSLKSLIIKKYDIRVLELDVNVKMFGKNDALSPLLSKFANSAVEKYKPKIIDAIEESIRKIIDKQLDEMGWEITFAQFGADYSFIFKY